MLKTVFVTIALLILIWIGWNLMVIARNLVRESERQQARAAQTVSVITTNPVGRTSSPLAEPFTG